MKNKLLIALMTGVTLLLPSCATLASARDRLEQMPAEKFDNLANKVYDAAFKAGDKLKELLASKPELKSDVLKLAQTLHNGIETDTLMVSDIVQYMVQRFGSSLGLDQKYRDLIVEAGLVIDAAVGQVRLGIDGKLSGREKALLDQLLIGLMEGLVSTN